MEEETRMELAERIMKQIHGILAENNLSFAIGDGKLILVDSEENVAYEIEEEKENKTE